MKMNTLPLARHTPSAPTATFFLRLATVFFLLFDTSLVYAQSPLLAEISRGDATVYILGGTEIPATTHWQSGQVIRAIEESESLTVLIPPANPRNNIPPFRQDIYPSERMHPVAIEEGYGNLGFGDYLDVSMGERSVVESQRLNLNGNWYRPMQPWVAYYYFGYNFWDQQPIELIDPQRILVETFYDSGKPVTAVFEDRADFFRLMGSMSDGEQTQFFQSLYNIMDWQRAGDYAARYTWTQGMPDESFLALHQQQTPLFYQFWYAEMNQLIADALNRLMGKGGKHFIYLDADRLLGNHNVIDLLAAANK